MRNVTVKTRASAVRFLQMHFQFAVLVADGGPFAPWLRPAFVEIPDLLAGHRQAAVEF